MAFISYLTAAPPGAGHLTNQPILSTEALAIGAEASVHRKAAAMTSDDSTGLSSQEMGKRFDLLATDAKEYAVFLVGLEGRLLCWNAGAERIFGYHSHEIIGQHFSRFFSPEDVLTGLPEHELKTATDERPGGRRLLAGPQGRNAVLVPGDRDAAAQRE